MQIRLISVGNKMPGWVEEGFATYQKRLNQEIQLQLVEIPAGKRGKNADLTRIINNEGELVLNSINSGEHIIALDVKGKTFTTEQLATRLETLMNQGTHVAILVGGPEGLSPACRQQAQEKWSLSALTLPHPLVRIVIAEQLYRCWSYLKGHPYHR